MKDLQAQVNEIARTVDVNKARLGEHLGDYKELQATVNRVDQKMTALVDPTIGLVPVIKESMDTMIKEISRLHGDFRSLDQYTRNGLTDSVKETRANAAYLRERLEGCEDDIIRLREEEARETGEKEGAGHTLAIHNRRREDKYKSFVLAVSVISVLTTVTIYIVDKVT